MTQDVNFYDKPLSDEEFVEIGELLALMPEPTVWTDSSLL